MIVPLTFVLMFGLAGTLGIILTADTRRRRAREDADALEAARLRLVAAGEDPDAPHVFTTGRHRADGTGGTVYGTPAVLDKRTAALVVDPTLTRQDVTTAIEHVAPGVGSVASVAAAARDTRMRTAAEQARLEADWDAAIDEVEKQEVRLFMADFDRQLSKALAAFGQATVRVGNWEAYQHRDNEHECEHCQRAVKETSDEYRLIRSLDDTGAISRADIEALYAAHAVAA